MGDRAVAGALLAATFTLGGVSACWGWWIVPLSIPPWLRGCGVGAALAAWVTAQVLLMRGSPRPGAGSPSAADEDPADASRE